MHRVENEARCRHHAYDKHDIYMHITIKRERKKPMENKNRNKQSKGGKQKTYQESTVVPSRKKCETNVKNKKTHTSLSMYQVVLIYSVELRVIGPVYKVPGTSVSWYWLVVCSALTFFRRIIAIEILSTLCHTAVIGERLAARSLIPQQ